LGSSAFLPYPSFGNATRLPPAIQFQPERSNFHASRLSHQSQATSAKHQGMVVKEPICGISDKAAAATVKAVMKKAGSRRSPKFGLSGKPPVSSHWRAANKRKIASTVCCFANKAGVGGAYSVEINIPEMDQRGGHGSRHSVMKVEGKLAIKMISSRGENWSVMWQKSSMKVPSIGSLEGMDAVGVGSAGLSLWV
jgi:hypothetical protein